MSKVRVVGQVAGSGSSEYHLRELEIARDRHRPEHAMPPYLPPPARILDIGCGAGQTLIAGFPDRVSFGLDVDFDALKLGCTLTNQVRFARGVAEALPYRSESFDMVVARVSLPYTRLIESLAEVHRVLRRDGRLWVVLHPFRMVWNQAQRGSYKSKILFAYILANSLLFHCFQKQFSIGARCESFQTQRGIQRALRRAGFGDIEVQLSSRQFLVTARKP
jgi:ubiquinone/menaquinone biosynthesis C-methylase UbiE